MNENFLKQLNKAPVTILDFINCYSIFGLTTLKKVS